MFILRDLLRPLQDYFSDTELGRERASLFAYTLLVVIVPFTSSMTSNIRGESLFLSKDFPCSQRGNPQKYRDQLDCYASPSRPGHSFATQQGDGSHALQ